MNAGLSLLLWDIAKLAELESKGLLPEQLQSRDDGFAGEVECKSEHASQSVAKVSTHDNIYASYKLLKKIFSDIYGANPELSWTELNNFINKQDTFIGKQLLFLEVFRTFIGDTAKYDHSEDFPDILFLTEPQDLNPILPTGFQCSGRFNSLTSSQVYQLFYQYFGINIEVYEKRQNADANTSWEKNTGECRYYAPSAQQLGVKHWACTERTIKLYFDGESGHFEILEGTELADAERRHASEKGLLNPKLRARFDEFSSSGDALSSKVGLIKLSYYVHSEILRTRDLNVEKSTKQNMVEHILKLCSQGSDYSLIAGCITKLQPLSDTALNNILEARSLAEYFDKFETAKEAYVAACGDEDRLLLQQATDAINKIVNSNDTSPNSHATNPACNRTGNIQEYQNARSSVHPTNNPHSHSLAFKIFTSIYAKLFMTILLIAAALTLTALLINTSQLPTAVANFIVHLAPRAFDALFGASIAVGAASGVGLIAAITLSNCDSGLFSRGQGAVVSPGPNSRASSYKDLSPRNPSSI